jgi:hypothetical protein
MVGASKILTVSYGTFSCTLEGFDDPFDTMKAIAEYFRDLAANDRFFGAEPPSPDPAMLHRIAEREVQRRVEAKIEDNGVILRAGDAVASGVGAEPLPPRVAGPVPGAPTGLLADEGVAAKLQRIRSAVARSASAGLPPLPDIEDAIFVEDSSARPAVTATVPEARATQPAETLAAPEPQAARPDPAATAPTGGPEDPLRDSLLGVLASLAAESQRLPGAGGKIELVPAAASEPAEVMAEPPAETSGDLAATTEPLSLPPGSDGPDPFDRAAPSDRSDDPSDHAAVAAAPQPGLAADMAPADPASAAEAVGADPHIVKDLPPVGPVLHVDPVPEPPAAEAAEPDAAAPADEAPAADAARLAESLRRARARVIKVRRQDAPAPAEAPGPDTEAPRPAEREGRAILQSGPDADEAVSRLLRHTNAELEGAASRRRLSTIAHLKAAVAATVADLRAPAAGTSPPSRTEPYRADLASVVHPRDADAPSAPDRMEPLLLDPAHRVDRMSPPANTGAAEPPAERPAEPARVLPRRITVSATSGDLPSAPDGPRPASGDFAAFADRLGASSMPDLLEAAAAYTICVEGQPHFTRPHLMRHVADLSDRYLGHQEDEMRGFGELLRQGRIAKVRRGQFVIPETSRVLAEARRLTH